jgi:hypothetical protein
MPRVVDVVTMNRIGLTAAVVVTLLTGSAWAQSSRSGASRVDFDDQLVQGQVNKGAVHLIERKDSDLGSLVKKRTSYRKEILAGTDVSSAKPAAAVAAIALPRQLPVVKAAELKGEAIEPIPETKPVVAPAKTVPAAKSSAKKAPAAKSKVPVKVDAKQSKKTNGGSRVVSQR